MDVAAGNYRDERTEYDCLAMPTPPFCRSVDAHEVSADIELSYARGLGGVKDTHIIVARDGAAAQHRQHFQLFARGTGDAHEPVHISHGALFPPVGHRSGSSHTHSVMLAPMFHSM